MKTTTTFAIFAIISAIGAAGIVASMSSFSVAHANQFGSCNQAVNSAEHSSGTDLYKGKTGADVRKDMCTRYK